ncbi:hypothetical protein F5Y00DRAFT_244704 [Daldinia vernicosa]|uniref:uncharacterized protein n=1 Tax=Daldinia vernicosa TaxID=114800 RepID=UPI002008CC42|nr:uncharacterized protein F5Y00DRAFT_244704 [Daldinia vernicosa]KAI0846181.1 hypothetical protein F5Y00DRAFT_244704 [Daldinia vernicosa]
MYAKFIFTTLALAGSLASATYAPEPIKVAERNVKPRQTLNPGGPVESLSSAADQGTTGVLSIQTDTSLSTPAQTDTPASLSIQTDTSLPPTIQTDTVISSITSVVSPTTSGSDAQSSTTDTSDASSSEESSISTSSSDGGAAYPQETGFALAAAAAAGLVGVVAAL